MLAIDMNATIRTTARSAPELWSYGAGRKASTAPTAACCAALYVTLPGAVLFLSRGSTRWSARCAAHFGPMTSRTALTSCDDPMENPDV